MAHTEIDSFVLKFKYLCSAGFKATLNVEAEDGKASIYLKANLGYTPSSFLHLYHHGSSPRVHRGPSYYRRQARRKTAQTAAAATSSHTLQADQADQADTSNLVAEQAPSTPTIVSEEDIIEDENKIENEENEETVQLAEKLNEKCECPICDFSNEWENGLREHLARRHSKLE